jgi:hypothetical protein
MKLKIVSDGTNSGTRLIDEDTGEMVHKIQKLTWSTDVENWIATTTIELVDVPVEIVSTAEIEIWDYYRNEDGTYVDLAPRQTISKEVKIVSGGMTALTTITDNQTKEPVSAVQAVKWEADPTGSFCKMKKICFGKEEHDPRRSS